MEVVENQKMLWLVIYKIMSIEKQKKYSQVGKN